MKLGSDPEIFACDEQGTVPAFFAMQGDADWTLPWGVAYPDGAAIEFTVMPSDSGPQISDRIWENIHAIKSMLGPYSLTLESNSDVGKYIPLLPESYGKRASLQILGCQKDIRVYDWVEDILRPDPKTYPFRTIGTHIHIELGEFVQNWPLMQFLTAYLDALIGTAGVYLLEGDKAAQERNVLYGKSGTIRLKNKLQDGYDGLEYRTLPSHAVLGTRVATEIFFATAQLTAQYVLDTFTQEGFAGLLACIGGVENLQAITYAIDEHDADVCRRLQKSIAERCELPIAPFMQIVVPKTYIMEI